MRKDRFQQLLKDTNTEMVRLTSSKGEEYANNESSDTADQHANFKRLSSELGLTPEQVLSVYLTKHIDAIKSYLRTGREFSEPIEGRVDDAILYLILLKGLVIEKRENALKPEMGYNSFC